MSIHIYGNSLRKRSESQILQNESDLTILTVRQLLYFPLEKSLLVRTCQNMTNFEASVPLPLTMCDMLGTRSARWSLALTKKKTNPKI